MNVDVEVPGQGLNALIKTAPELNAIQTKSSGYRPDIDGLRAIAVFSVVTYHVGLRLFRGGFVGVDIFFVISGYLISSHIYKEVQAGRFSFSAFYARRAKRILPALYFLLAFIYVAAVILLSPLELKAFATNVTATLFSVSNIRFWLTSNYFSPNAELNPLLMTWSLGVEEQFYVFFPMLILLLFRTAKSKLFSILFVLAGLSLALAGFDVLTHPLRSFYLIPTRAWELGSGALLGLHETTRSVPAVPAKRRYAELFGVVGLGLLLYPIVIYSKTTPFPGMYALPPVLGSLLVIMAGGSMVSRLLSLKPLMFLGLISYSWYLWHWPLLSFARLCVDRELDIRYSAAIAAASIGFAYVSYKYVEQPFRRSKTNNWQILGRYVVASVALLVPSLVLSFAHGWPQRYPRVAEIEKGTSVLGDDPCLAAYGKSLINTSSRCIPSKPDRDAVALLGDSHAAAMSEVLREKAAASHLNFYQLTKASCPPFVGVSRFMQDHPEHFKECAAYNQRALAMLLAHPDIKYVVVGGYWSSALVNADSGERYADIGGDPRRAAAGANEAELAKGLNALVSQLALFNRQVVLMEDVPAFSFDPRRRVISSMIPARNFLMNHLSDNSASGASVPLAVAVTEEDKMASRDLQKVSLRYPGVRIIDPKKTLCDAATCKFLDGSALLYSDREHLSTIGTELVFGAYDLTAQ